MFQGIVAAVVSSGGKFFAHVLVGVKSDLENLRVNCKVIVCDRVSSWLDNCSLYIVVSLQIATYTR